MPDKEHDEELLLALQHNQMLVCTGRACTGTEGSLQYHLWEQQG